jgi:hypothetical protein
MAAQRHKHRDGGGNTSGGGGGRHRRLIYAGLALFVAGWLAWMLLLTESEEGEVVGSVDVPAHATSHVATVSG